MKSVSQQLCLLAGMWCSAVALVMAISIILPSIPSPERETSATVYAGETLPEPTAIAEGTVERALLANLENMQLSLYENGTLIKTVPVLSKGKEGTPWETPHGKYAIQAKEEKHFSSIGGVWMPYSMQFYGNFFIHGWPTYSDGRDVPIGFSGGCIRLSTDDAKEVYEFVSPGTRLVVEGGGRREEFATTSRYSIRGGGHRPSLGADAFLAADFELGTSLWEYNADALQHPGNLVAMMSALTALETVNQYKVVRMSELLMGKAVLRKTSVGAADEVPVGALIYPLLFGANDTAAKVFAREHGTRQFVTHMNEKSAAIGMQNSAWSGPLSMDAATTTARDLFMLLQYLDRSKRFLIDVSLASERVLYNAQGEERYRWENKNPWMLEKDARYRGGLIDLNHDGGGNAMLLFSLPVSEFGSRTVALIVLGSKDIKKDVTLLRDFLSTYFVYGITRESAAGGKSEEGSGWSVRRLWQEHLEYEKEI